MNATQIRQSIAALVSFLLLANATACAAFQIAADTPKKPETVEEEADKSTELSNDVDEILAGHSYHGQAFNEGPRQKAYMMGGTGNVNFPVTTQSAEAQAFINQGVGQLHGFWTLEAERSFRHAAAIDPDCAMAYWGAAWANAKSAKERAKGFIDEAIKRTEGITQREKLYIEALDRYLKSTSKKKSDRAKKLVSDMEKICVQFPEDIEAKAFVAYRVWENASEGVPISSHLSTESLLKEIFERQPLHPAHHYRIHLWDREAPERALQSAERCGISAPRIAHMWHMPGHIYSRLKRYEDAIFYQEASARVDHAHMMRDQIIPDAIHNFAHNNEWLIRNMIFVGRANDAVALSRNMIELPQHPKYNTFKKRGSANYGRKRLVQTLTSYQLYEESVRACLDGAIPDDGDAKRSLERNRLLGMGYAMTGQTQKANEVIARLNQQLAVLKKQKKAKPDAAKSKKASDNNDAAKPEVKKVESKDGQSTDKPEKPATQDKSEDKKAKKPKPSRVSEQQVLRAIRSIEGYLALAKQEYQAAYDKFQKGTADDQCFLAEVLFLSGKPADAIKRLKQEVKRRKNEVIPQARLVYVLWKNGNLDEAKREFEKLRSISGCMDLEIDLFSRLKPLARSLGHGSDWRNPHQLSADTEFRPNLDDLGPFRWSPPTAPAWLIDRSGGEPASSSSFDGKSHIVIFYLGHGCLHCAEQLQAFGPKTADFEQAGISLLAISSDDESGLKQSVAAYEGEMPIPLLADPKKEIFKKFRAYDDFENQPLHGTFLINGSGQILWQDIGYEPFMEPEFLLKESTRLLKIHADKKKASDIELNKRASVGNK